MSRYSYKGRHRKESASSARLLAATVAAAGLLGAGVALAPEAAAAPGADLNAIAHCESGGNPRATNGSHFGLFQFDLSTWRSVGGTGNPMDASVATQYALAAKLMASRGTQPWNASRNCWQGKSVAASAAIGIQVGAVPPPTPKKVIPKVATASPKIVAPPPRIVMDVVDSQHSPAGLYHVLAGDTLSKIAAMQNVPGGWQSLFEKNKDKIQDPNLIYVGQDITL